MAKKTRRKIKKRLTKKQKGGIGFNKFVYFFVMGGFWCILISTNKVDAGWVEQKQIRQAEIRTAEAGRKKKHNDYVTEWYKIFDREKQGPYTKHQASSRVAVDTLKLFFKSLATLLIAGLIKIYFFDKDSYPEVTAYQLVHTNNNAPISRVPNSSTVLISTQVPSYYDVSEVPEVLLDAAHVPHIVATNVKPIVFVEHSSSDSD